MRREVDPDIYCPQAALVDEELNRKTEERLARYRARYEAAKLHKEMVAMQHQQRQQMVWMAGGTLVAIALSLIWFKRFGQRAKRKSERGSKDSLPNDLLLDEDEFNGTEEELQQVFGEAAKVAQKFPDGMLEQRDQLMLYGLYKQAREGDRSGDAPSKLNVVAYAKYDAWGKFQGLPKQFAMKKYCEVVYHFSSGGESSFAGGNKSNDESGDAVYDDDEHVELDEDGCPVDQDEDESDEIMVGGFGMKPSTLMGDPGDVRTSQSKDESGTPEMHLRSAAMSNDLDALEKVIVGGVCDIDAADESGQTALHFAADRGSIDCLNVLVDAGANVNASDCDGIGVLQTALSAGLEIDSVRILLEAGADPEACDCDGDSSRMWVEEDGDEALVELFSAFPAR